MNDNLDRLALQRISIEAMQIAGLYAACALIWIYCSDSVLTALDLSPSVAAWMQTAKGFGYILTTSILLYFLCRRRLAELKRSHRRLAESNRKHLTLLGNLPGMAYRCHNDEHWTIEFVSSGVRALTGYARNDLLSEKISYDQIIHPRDREAVRRKVTDAIETHSSFILQYRIHTIAGRTRWVWEKGRPIFRNGMAIALEGFVMDITERKKASRLRRERRAFKESSRAMDEALGVVGHELRTPLAALRAISETLLDGEVRDPADAHSFLRDIHTETIRMAELVDNMLDSARLRSGQAAWQWSTVPLRRVAHDALQVVRPLVDGAKVTLRISAPRKLTMNGDAGAVRRLILNLLTNAARSTLAGRITVTIDAPEAAGESWVRIRVADTGGGIPPEKLRSLGDAFALNAGAVRSGSIGGVGLGLSICRQIIAAHDGHVSVESHVGAGTTFTVKLRADLPDAASIPHEMPPIARNAPGTQPRRLCDTRPPSHMAKT